jgi:4-amino-4-deoxy-L-arabinose transferase-like glycosyltransferase
MPVRSVITRAGWGAGLAGITLIALVAFIQLGRLLGSVVSRWPGGAGAGGILAVTAFVVVAGVLIAMPSWAPGRWRSPLTMLVFGLALTAAVRLALVILIEAPVPVDGVDYRAMAIQMANGSCCAAERSPGLPMLLAGPYAAFGPIPAVHEAINLLAGVVGGWLLYAIVRAESDADTAAAALIAYGLIPSMALLTPVLLTETVFTTLVLGAIWAVRLAAGLPRPWLMAALGGVLLAGSQYVRQLAPLLLPGALVVPLLGHPSLRRGAAVAATILLAFTVGVLPIVAHNLQAHGELSIASSSFSGALLYIGTDRQTVGRISPELARDIRTLPGADQWERSKTAERIALQRITDDPIGFARLAARKVPIMWGTDEAGVRYAFSRAELRRPLGASLLLMSQIAYLAVVLGALAGLWMARRRLSPTVVAIALLVVGTIGLHFFVEVKPRYHVWLIPLLLVLAAPVIGWVLSRLRGRRALRA